jgi:hypothetical protein
MMIGAMLTMMLMKLLQITVMMMAMIMTTGTIAILTNYIMMTVFLS